MGRVSGKTVIVTGGARGLGAAFARALVAEGASVVIADVLAEEGKALAGELGGRADFAELDVTDHDAWERVVAEVTDRNGPVSGLVNNAGIVHVGSIESLDEADYRRVIDVNQIGVFLGMKAVLPSMRRAGGGSIVNISSIGGIIAFSGIVSYTASKWAVRGMTKTAAQEFGADGVRVNSVHPGVVATEMTADSDRSQGMVTDQPLARRGTAEELANLVLFLISDESSFCTGSEFVADGGYTSQ
ncbi:glucose 1-dehydrogenase [Haloechinothrix sp. YIM 98757]|uniref:Glucose 1-dehydrogenase n=1 Tax=Haloechinothrix aidingensis TaxID=2752311 RepID=A0A838ABI1_9PSEU|nr:glucose 1-dehydrogenase [Haloechinothrix aidingensis]MBA0126558.1 glucose 1-dehydrogenase [Haloechinothrix aidingensis]